MFDQDFDLYTEKNAPGFAALVVKNGETIYEKCFGYASLEHATRITNKTNFDLASLSKQFTAMGFLLLQQAGMVSSQDKVARFFPEAPSWLRDVQVSHLIYHSAGLPDYYDKADFQQQHAMGAPYTNKEIIQKLFQKEGLKFPPGQQFSYSNLGYILLAAMIERVSQKPFALFMKERIFDKLGMDDTFIMDENCDHATCDYADGYNAWPLLRPQARIPEDYMTGSKGVYTNLVDYKKWLGFIDHPERLLRPEFHHFIFQPDVLVNNGQNYAYGWVEEPYKNGKLIFHGGEYFDFKSYSAHVPNSDLWVVLFSNYKGFDSDAALSLFLEEFD